MFDKPAEPEDIFSSTESAPTPRPAAPVPSPAPSAPRPPAPPPAAAFTPPARPAISPAPETPVVSIPPEPASPPSIPWKLILIVVGVFAVVGVAAALSWWLLSSRQPTQTVVPNTSNTATNTPVNTAPPVVNTPVNTAPVVNTPAPTPIAAPEADADKDGLSDAQEAEIGTNPNNPDTDGDGLFDNEEVNTYHTDPLNPDTDGDGYMDGAEVNSGYNPNGPGKLYGVPAQ